MGYSFRLTAMLLFFYAPSHRQDNTYHSLCYTSRGALAGTRNSSVIIRCTCHVNFTTFCFLSFFLFFCSVSFCLLAFFLSFCFFLFCFLSFFFFFLFLFSFLSFFFFLFSVHFFFFFFCLFVVVVNILK